jgi:hypothetical protein
VIDTLGPQAYQVAVEEADQRFRQDEDLKRFLQGIERTEAREIIYGTVFELAMADVVSGREPELLSWLAQTWQLESRPETPTD